MAILESVSQTDIEQILYADSYFISRRNKEEKADQVKYWLTKMMRARFDFPLPGSFKAAFFRSIPRDDYKELFHSIIDCSGILDCVVIEDYELECEELCVDLSLSRYLTKNLSFIDKVSGADIQERLFKTLKLIYYAYIVEQLDKYSFEVITFFADMQPVEHLASLYFSSKGVVTATMQHGLYVDYNNMETVNVINYRHHPSNYFLAWGGNTLDLIVANHPAANVVVCGKPTLEPIESNDIGGERFFVVVLDQEIFQEQNCELIEYAKMLAKDYKLTFSVKFHPHNNRKYYEKKHGDIRVASDFVGAFFVIGHTSSLIHEWRARGGAVFQYITAVPTIAMSEKLTFRNYEEFSLRYKNLNGVETISDIESYEISFISAQSKDKYRSFYRSLFSTGGPFFTIVVPTFNSEKTIARCLDSLSLQTYSNYEIIVVDGCSSDLTIALVSNYEDRDSRVKLFSEPDRNVYDAMNKGLLKASGQWIYFMGSDDQLYDQYVLEKVAAFVQQKNIGMVYGNVRVRGDVKWAKDGVTYDGEFSTDKIQAKNICHQAIFYNANAIADIGEYNIDYRVCADWDMNLRIWSKYKCEYMDDIIANFFSGGTSTEGGDPEFGRNFKRIKSELFG